MYRLTDTYHVRMAGFVTFLHLCTPPNIWHICHKSHHLIETKLLWVPKGQVQNVQNPVAVYLSYISLLVSFLDLLAKACCGVGQDNADSND